ncbi:MAG TPA: hypothetical protein VHI52_02410, partial [Verrucomicrobiae bacterium]|nr:hypothetical protein [Verrucomicrobiae bacterium]
MRFTADFNLVGTVTNPPYQTMVRLPQTGTTTIRAIATDQYGNDGPFAPLVITVQPPRPPALQFSLVSPTNGPLPTGSFFIVDVTASADTGISNFTALAGGAATGSLLSTNGAHLRLQGFVPTNAIAGEPVQIFAQVTDNLGLSSGQQVFVLPTVDATPPTLAISGPTNSAVFNSGGMLSLSTVASDNSSNLTFNLLISGSVTATQTLASPLIPNQPRTNIFAVGLTNGSPLGGPFTASLSATDAAGNAAQVTRTFQLRGPPPTVQIVRVTPPSGPVPSGSMLVLDVVASGGNGITQLRTDVTGAITNSITTNTAGLHLQLAVPPAALAGQSVHIAAQATDSLGQASSPATLDLSLSDGTPPNLVVSGPTNDTLFLTGQELDLSTITSDNSSNTALILVLSGSVSATQSLALALAPGVAVTNLFTFPLTNVSPQGGSFSATITAIDASANATVVSRTFQVMGPGPTLEFIRVSPTAGPVPSGSSFSVRISATGGNGIASFSANLSGAVTNGPFTTLGTTLLVQGQVPTTAVLGQQIRITSEAVDALGRSSGLQLYTLDVSDGTVPEVTILGPPQDARLDPSLPLGLTVLASDNSTNVNLTLGLSGSLISTQHVTVTLSPNTLVTNLLIAPLSNAFASGGLLTATVIASDGAGNAASAIRNFFLPPLATSVVTWERQAFGQTFSC